MAIKPGTPTSYRHNITGNEQVKRGVGETYRDRREYTKKRGEAEVEKSSFLGKVRDFFTGSKGTTIHRFSSNAQFVGGIKTISKYHKDLENGVKGGPLATDSELLDILDAIRKK